MQLSSPQAEEDEAFDEAEFLKELALLESAEGGDVIEPPLLGGSGAVSAGPLNIDSGESFLIHSTAIPFPPRSRSNPEADEEESDENDDPASLRTWKQHLSRKDEELREFERELGSVAASHGAATESLEKEGPCSGGAAADDGESDGGGPLSVQAAMAGLRQLILAGGDVTTTTMQREAGADGREAGATGSGEAILDLSGPATDASTMRPASSSLPPVESSGVAELERRALFDEYRAEEQRRAAERERVRREELESARLAAREAQERAAALLRATEEERARRMAAIEAAAEAERLRLLAEAARADAEARRLVEERRAVEDAKARMVRMVFFGFPAHCYEHQCHAYRC